MAKDNLDHGTDSSAAKDNLDHDTNSFVAKDGQPPVGDEIATTEKASATEDAAMEKDTPAIEMVMLVFKAAMVVLPQWMVRMVLLQLILKRNESDTTWFCIRGSSLQVAGPIHDASAIGFHVAALQSHLEGVARAYSATKFFDCPKVQQGYNLGNESRKAIYLRNTLLGHLAEA
ncbi:hypothetical protein CCACVL1_17315 [Corchorus capsularis]|uniref:Uncharacterized protein n=1 Tax=Corchorus capsularis TaxID=210143 RepID=A0A1R3HSK4_COCAP|nr:hypothetical protein CCACVL1_17315 [Corchorus capsularis]